MSRAGSFGDGVCVRVMSAPTTFGPKIDPDGITFRLWAPSAQKVELVLDRPMTMPRGEAGWHALRVPGVQAGAHYRFRIDGELEVPDPASQFQPEDVFGPSEVVAHAYPWQCSEWRGRRWHETVLSELHVGTFSKAGTFRGAIEHLDALAETGITAIELMPIADFAGKRNWGYDGVLLYAPDSAYGRPEDLKALIDAAHARGLMVFLDVVYNHFGPEGNYLSRYAAPFFTADHKTPWGDAIDYRIEEVRNFAIENALHWLDHYRFDGLRLDAVHAIAEPSRGVLLQSLSCAAGELAATSGRHIHLVLENDDNTASLLDGGESVPRGKYRAQWNDDYHHAWHVLLTGERAGYYRDYPQPLAGLARALADGFVYQGEPSEHRAGALRGEPSRELPPTAFVDFLQNHDQIGNRPFGDRLTTLVSTPAIEAALAVLLLAPSPPMLFMGDEWGATEPFPFFCDFKGDLAEAVRKGRAAEFAAAFAAASREIPDPLAVETFQSAVLDWSQRESAAGAKRLELVRALLAARRQHIVPLLAGGAKPQADASADDTLLTATWRFADRVLRLAANLSDTARPPAAPIGEGAIIWGATEPVQAPWSVVWSIGKA